MRFLIILSFMSSNPVVAQPLDEVVAAAMAKHSIPSLSVAQIENGKVIRLAAWGDQTPGVKATPQTLYNIASMTKPIAAEAMLRLVAEGKAQLDEPMVKWWLDPDLIDDSRRIGLTLRIALSHQTGFPNWRFMDGGKLRFRHDPGTRFGYSGEGYEYAARYIEKRVGRDFESLATSQIFKPLNMNETALTRRSWFEGRIASPTDKNGKILPPTIRDSLKFSAADDGYTTPSDYARFLISLLQPDQIGQKVAAERNKMQISAKGEACQGDRIKMCPDDVGYGLGWAMMKSGDHNIYWHSGSDRGEATIGWWEPATGRGGVIFTNSAKGDAAFPDLMAAMGADPALVKFLKR
jgi:CubicO group peptidase (beta-lactamase class C family)